MCLLSAPVVLVRLRWVRVIRFSLLVSRTSGVDSVYSRDSVPRMLRTISSCEIG